MGDFIGDIWAGLDIYTLDFVYSKCMEQRAQNLGGADLICLAIIIDLHVTVLSQEC